jgi:signal transduction histidine kinase/FixJ family two-component response regulator
MTGTPRGESAILLVDGHERDRKAVRQTLVAAGLSCTLVEAADVRAALGRKESIDCVLLDCLDESSAIELFTQLRNRWPNAAIIVLTGQGSERIAVELMKAGAVDSISKHHLHTSELVRAVRHALTLQSAQQRLQRVERAHLRYTAKLQELVELAPTLFTGRTLEERLTEIARVARTILDGREALVGVRGVGSDLCLIAHADGEVAPLDADDQAWCKLWAPSAIEKLSERLAPVEIIRPAGAPTDLIGCCRIRMAEGAETGLLAIRGDPLAPELVDAFGLLLAQLAQTVRVALDSVRLLEATQRAVESRDAVMAVVSHDLRAPLSSFGLGLQLLQDSVMDEESKSVLARMEHSAKHMKRLIEDLLDVSHIENRSFSVTPQPEAVESLFREIKALMAPIAEASRISFVVTPPPAAKVLAERIRVVQVLSNLLGNALKFTPADGTVQLSAEAQGDEVHFSIRDSGPGIERAHLERVFERYWRKDRRGLGLGLFIAKAIVTAHGGRIWADSRPQAGSTFTFALRSA